MIFRFSDTLVEGVFLKRLNRFTCFVRVDGEDKLCHVPNSGRMKELLIPGVSVLLQYKESSHRKTDFDLFLVMYNGNWISVDSRLPNWLFEYLIRKSLLPDSSVAYSSKLIKKEPSYGEGRFDLKLAVESGEQLLVELKSVTLAEDGRALFPDAPTERGRRHLQELIRAQKDGYQSLVVFFGPEK